MVSRSAVKESSSTCSCLGMVKLPPYGSVLGMSSLQLERPEEILWKSHHLHLKIGRASSRDGCSRTSHKKANSRKIGAQKKSRSVAAPAHLSLKVPISATASPSEAPRTQRCRR